jgi:hypothetical protein
MAEIGRFVDSKVADLEADGVAITQLNYDNLENQSAEIGALIDCPATAVDKAISEQFKKSTKDYNNLLTADEIQDIKNAFGLA